MHSSNTRKCVSIESCTISLTCPSQGCKGVEAKLGDLVLWLTQLNTVTTTNVGDKHEEAERREQFPSIPYHFTDPSQLRLC